MAKRYYWLKLPDGFFRQKAIKKLRKIAGGDTYTIIYLKMLLVAMKQDGRLYFEGVEATFYDELALDLDEEVENVRVTVMFLIQQDLMQLIDETEYSLSECSKMTGSERAVLQPEFMAGVGRSDGGNGLHTGESGRMEVMN
ncbi:phage replisome organizer N-terminal domain-containing protein [Blautia obeum]|uniref:phage replisome organizer N-terminal domain-containing protein n=1 Tax=Blautia obeum TaxID=40520 RepID=UPI0032191B97